MALGLELEAARVDLEHVGERAGGGGVDVAELAAQVVAREGDGAAGVLLLDAAEEVGRVPDLGLDLLLAVAEVVVRDDGDDDAALVAGDQLEGLAVVVALVGVFPAHAVTALALGGLVPGRQAKLLLGQGGQVGSEDDAAGVPGPALRRQRGVVLRQEGIAGVAEDALDEVEVGHQATRGDEPDLHPTLGREAGDLGHDDGPQQQRDETAGGLVLGGGPRQGEQVLRGVDGGRQDPGEDVTWDGLLVIRDGQASLGHVEDAGGGAAVVARVVQHALQGAVALDVGGGEARGVQRKRQRACQARLVEDEGVGRQVRVERSVLKVGVEEGLDAAVSSAQAAGQAPAHLTLTREDRGHEAIGDRISGSLRSRKTQQVQSQRDGGVESGVLIGRSSRSVGALRRADRVHASTLAVHLPARAGTVGPSPGRGL